MEEEGPQMMRAAALLAFLALLPTGCGESIDYDIEEVAPSAFLSGEDEHGAGEHHHEEGEEGYGEEAGHDEEIVDDHPEGMHVHEAGVRNHGTQWFFNQPWAATFVWGKMLRDGIVLLVLAASVSLLPVILRKRR
jgi:hypothetical protein